MPGRDDEPLSGVPQTWGPDRGTPMVVVAPAASEPVATRGATGLFVIAVLVVSVVVATFFAYQNWKPDGYAEQMTKEVQITKESDVERLQMTLARLERQNRIMCSRPLTSNEPVPNEPRVHPLLMQIDNLRQENEGLCEDNARRARRNAHCRAEYAALERAKVCEAYTGPEAN